jgi:hypothetical protein
MSKKDLELGGMNWQVTPPKELQGGHAFRMTCVEDFSGDPSYPIIDKTTITRLEDGSVHMAFDSERNGSHYNGSHEFPVGALRAIIDHVEPLEGASEQTIRTPRQGWLSRALPWKTSPSR